ncbi:MAG: TylF/MycF/NovP-related O-methyltransferase [Pseudomonadota bacterium]
MKIRNPLRGLMRSKSDPLDRWRPEPLARTTQKAMQILDAVNDTAGLAGAVVECGVGSGFSLAIFAMTLDGRQDERALWAFDSFEGFPEGNAQDADWFSPDRMTVYEAFDVDWVKDYIATVSQEPRLATRPHFVPGFFPGSFSQFDDSPISLLHLDVDLYQSYVDCFDFFAPRLLPGSIILLDEYDRGTDETKWPGAKLAVDEFAEKYNLAIEKHYTGFAQLRIETQITER